MGNTERKRNQNIIKEDNPIHNFNQLQKIMNSGIEKCVCKIVREANVNGKLVYKTGTGFFCNLPSKQIKLFITNNHVLDKQFLNEEKKLILYQEKDNDKIEKIINLENRYTYTDEEIDFTIIEILDEDYIYDFLEIDDYINSKDYKD